MNMRRSIGDLMKKIKLVLSKEGELSIRRISVESKSTWASCEKALEIMKSLGLVRERWAEGKRRVRLFGLVNVS